MKRTGILLAGMMYSLPASAMNLPPVPTGPVYYEPPVLEADDRIQTATCYEIDRAINALQPYKYTYKPNFYHDRTNQFATTLILFDSIPIVEGWLGLAYLGYSAILDEKESRRVQQVQQQIAMLQRVKAEKFCFE